MTSMGTLLALEARRALSRRFVRGLLAVGALLAVTTGVLARVLTSEQDVLAADRHIGRLTDLAATDGDSVLAAALLYLAIGALIGGASVAGAEWRFGTVTTVLTWSPRRGRLLLARITAAATLAAVLSCALQVLLGVALLPTWLGPGTIEGIDGAWANGVVLAVCRSSLVCALAAAVGAAAASIGRNTTAALGGAFVELAIVEAAVRTNFPAQARWLLGENLTTFFTWEPPEHAAFERGPVVATATLVLYVAVLVGFAVTLFRRRDLVGAG